MAEKKNKALVKAKKARETTNKLMLTPSWIKARQLLHILQKTPKEHIYTRPARGGGEWDYVTGTYVKKVLNYVFGWMWDFEVMEHGREGDLVWVLGKLTVKDKKGFTISKTQFGRADVKIKKGTKTPLDYGNDLKAATTDALKKCASEFGIASDVYGKNEFKEVRVEAVEIGGQKVKGLFAGQKEKQQIEKYCRELGANDPDKAYDIVKKLTGIELNLEKLTKTDSLTIIAALLQKQTAKRNGKKN